MKSEQIIEALKELNPELDEHWTTQGEPMLKVLSTMVGETVTREEVKEVAPFFYRTNPTIEATTNFGDEGLEEELDESEDLNEGLLEVPQDKAPKERQEVDEEERKALEEERATIDLKVAEIDSEMKALNVKREDLLKKSYELTDTINFRNDAGSMRAAILAKSKQK